MDYSISVWIVAIPFIVFLFNGLIGDRIKPIYAGLIGVAGLATSFILSCIVAFNYFFVNGKVEGVYQKIIALDFLWLNFTDKLHINLGILLDPISIMMLIVVTTVSLMVHIYSIGYMHGEFGFTRFFSFLSLFTFSMLGLVVATNLFQMYIFWELVGVSSFLLIGYYYEKDSAILASKKAFIVTRFADFGFLVGILVVSYITGTFDFEELTHLDPNLLSQNHTAWFLGMSVFTWGLIFIFIGGAGKSAMFPLHIWLPDAMEGPTPVSALIHAATMVVAGVYLVARLFPLFAHFEYAKDVVMYIGAFSSLFAAVIACTQFDIKRVLAFSTMSQIGYMMLALGVSGYGGEEGLGYMASMFHLFTHAMFKALLFLAAGSIIHAVHTNDLREMGGLKKYMPITFITFTIGWLAICGFPGFSGFFSKDEILVAAFMHNKVIFFSSVLVAGLTAFYMSRLYFSIFFGKHQHYHHTPHESPLIMSGPLMFLAVLAAVAGYIPFHHLVTSDGVGFDAHFHWNIAIPVTLLAFGGMGLAAFMYLKPTTVPDKIAGSLKGVYTAVLNKFYFDELYLFITRKIIFDKISKPILWFDRHVIDASMDGLSWVANKVSDKIRGFQSGQIQQYAFVFVSGVILLVLTFVYIFAGIK